MKIKGIVAFEKDGTYSFQSDNGGLWLGHWCLKDNILSVYERSNTSNRYVLFTMSQVNGRLFQGDSYILELLVRIK